MVIKAGEMRLRLRRNSAGARPLKRTIQRELQDPLALKILSGEFKDGIAILVDRGADGWSLLRRSQRSKAKW
jgi:ATP-dependent Clp protease ATP-binding subunit ClpA